MGKPSKLISNIHSRCSILTCHSRPVCMSLKECSLHWIACTCCNESRRVIPDRIVCAGRLVCGAAGLDRVLRACPPRSTAGSTGPWSDTRGIHACLRSSTSPRPCSKPTRDSITRLASTCCPLLRRELPRGPGPCARPALRALLPAPLASSLPYPPSLPALLDLPPCAAVATPLPRALGALPLRSPRSAKRRAAHAEGRDEDDSE